MTEPAPELMPSPDWTRVELRWAGTYLDGTPCDGTLDLTYDGGVALDDDTVLPLNIFPSKLSFPIGRKTVAIEGVAREVGYAAFHVPASNDPDIQGAGGTYTLVEKLAKGGGRTHTFAVDIATAADGIWLSKIAPSAPSAGEPISVVYYSDFTDFKASVEALIAERGYFLTNPTAEQLSAAPPNTAILRT